MRLISESDRSGVDFVVLVVYCLVVVQEKSSVAHHLFNYTLIDTQTGTIINPANCVLVHDDRMDDLDDSASDSEINDFGIQYGHKLVDIVDDDKLC